MPLRIKRIYGNTWCLRTPVALLPFYKLNEREIVLIDSGSDQDGSVAEYFAGLDLKVRTLLLTHAHFDHIGGAAALRRRFDTQIYLSEAEKQGTIPVFGKPDYEEPEEICRFRETYRCIPNYRIPVTARFLQIEKAQFEVIFCPGHSDGHTAFVTPDGVCCLGDLVSSPNYLSAVRMLYIKDHALDRESKQKLRKKDFPCCVAAHKKVFPGTELAEMIDKNLGYVRKLREQIQKAALDAGEDVYGQIFRNMEFHPTDLTDEYILHCSIESILRDISRSGHI